MAPKPFRYNELSDKVYIIPGCNRRIKKNVLARKPDAETCYRCDKEAKQVSQKQQISNDKLQEVQ